MSFGLSLVLHWNFNQAFITALITAPSTYLAAFFVDKRHRNYEMLVLDSLYKRIRELEGVKSHVVGEINQLENHRNSLYSESNQLKNQIGDRRSQRDSLNRELSSYITEQRQLELVIDQLKNEINSLEKSKIELNNSFVAEKRKQELNVSVSRAEITQLQIQINELKKEKEELENNLTLLDRLKPQLEEKLHELRVQMQKLEAQEQQKKELISAKTNERKNLETKIKSLQDKLKSKQAELKHLQEQISLLQDERNLLQTQVWELLQQMENLNPEEVEHIDDTSHDILEEAAELFPFSELIETLDSHNTNSLDKSHVGNRINENLENEWHEFVYQLSSHDLQVLKAILEQENPNPSIKKIAEANITMPNLLIDSINEIASNTIGELIINTTSEFPSFEQEHMTNIQKVVETYETIIAQRSSSN
ncbi:tellurite resistance TerB C-terminal domain-containing protein [Calothrix sp. UHCC 0171]|uniref:tellurite resistance TerB C-terminal domain-containing protein n=1 Tax=Calothrix sp. UHCC 0171 TaxID=3110245 RepID=UPI002B209DDA|nr:tellurite resistance TerB C-terminal domain-containing protein [Calothrix sp. UHCC 0171]MEA5571403.1 tellurite resistance TerB C-terminal domain-containing protein [Calothrix sp. UHCC 0171]